MEAEKRNRPGGCLLFGGRFVFYDGKGADETSRIDLLAQLAGEVVPPAFRIVRDRAGNEFVVFRDSALPDVLDFDVDDKTLFEATENHIHFFSGGRIRRNEMPYLKSLAKCLCPLVLGRLEADFPGKQFIVYAAIQVNESVIFRFHRLWPDEPPYYGESGDPPEDRDLIIVSARSGRSAAEEKGS